MHSSPPLLLNDSEHQSFHAVNIAIQNKIESGQQLANVIMAACTYCTCVQAINLFSGYTSVAESALLCLLYLCECDHL